VQHDDLSLPPQSPSVTQVLRDHPSPSNQHMSNILHCEQADPQTRRIEADQPTRSPIREDDISEPNTDEEIWVSRQPVTRKKTNQRDASTALVEAVKENWTDICDTAVSRQSVFERVAAGVRKKGIRISRDPRIAWDKVYRKWRKLKEEFYKFVKDNTKTGTNPKQPPFLYREMHDLLGNSFFITLYSFHLLLIIHISVNNCFQLLIRL